MNRLLGILLALGAATAAAAPPPEAAAEAAADELGRLFTTPEQRRLLDRSRAATAETAETAETAAETAAPPPAPPPAPAPPRLDGIVLRGERPVACWLDGIWQPRGEQCPQRP